MTAYSKGLDPHLEEKKAAPGLYKNLPDYDPKVFLDLDPETFKSVVLDDKQVAHLRVLRGNPLTKKGYRRRVDSVMESKRSLRFRSQAAH